MEIYITPHAELQAHERGVLTEEILAAVRGGDRFAAHSGRIGAAIVLPYNKVWGRRRHVYPHKRVVVFFVEDAVSAVVVTVISQYGQWEA